MDGLQITNVMELPLVQPLEKALTPKKKRRRQSLQITDVMEVMELPLVQPLDKALTPRKRRSRQSQSFCKEEKPTVLMGSDESDSDVDSGDEALVYPFVPRAFRIAFDTPMDSNSEDEEDFAEGLTAVDPTACTSTTSAAAPEVPKENTELPWSMFDFNWTPFPDPPISPELRRETFSPINVGPTTPCVDPYDIFVAIWDQQIMEHIALETNRYAYQTISKLERDDNLPSKSRLRRWVDVTVDELYVFFALILAMGVVVKTRFDEYWNVASDIFCTPGFGAHMPINRFILINKFLHFNNNEDVFELNLTASDAKLFKIQPLLSHLNKKFADMYVLQQNIALDESLLQWKGWLDINQVIPNKAATVGIKSYEICESQTGYLWRFEIHTYKKSPPKRSGDLLSAPTPAIVLRLVQGLENKGYTLWMDNFYNSPILARALKTLGFDCVGTLRTNRKFVPQALHNLTKQNMLKGEVTGCTSGDVDVLVFRDNSRVATISTYHGIGVAECGESVKPIVILDYNIMMGGVDKKDQLLSMYPIERKRSNVWYKKLFRRLLNVSTLNAYIIHKSSVSSRPLAHRSFRKSLINSILSKHSISPPVTRPYEPVRTCQQAIDLTHRVSNKGARRKCKICKKRVFTYCIGCNKNLCQEECFVKFHALS